MFLTPSEIHAHEHRRPVLAFGAAGAGIDFEHHAERVFFAAQHIAQFKTLNLVDGVGIHGIEFGLVHVAFFHEVECHLEVVDSAFHLLVTFNPGLEILYFLHLHLCLLGMFPEVGHVGAQFFFFYLYFLVVDVKDTSSAPACAQKSLLIVPG